MEADTKALQLPVHQDPKMLLIFKSDFFLLPPDKGQTEAHSRYFVPAPTFCSPYELVCPQSVVYCNVVHSMVSWIHRHKQMTSQKRIEDSVG